MEKAIANKLSLRDLETVIGGTQPKERTYVMDGNTYVCTRDGCTKTKDGDSNLLTWIKSWL